jgi:G:T/U-mismatch repair DNA glycosylase
MFEHRHPYEPYLPKGLSKLIVGTLPPPRFSLNQLKDKDVHFCYGSRDGLLWPIIDSIFHLDLIYQSTQEAIDQRKRFLQERGIGICDIVATCKRDKVDASDLGMKDIVLRDVVGYLMKYESIEMVLFTGGNSRNGPEFLFRRHLKQYGVKLKRVSGDIPRVHRFELPDGSRMVTTVSLTAPSGSANRAIGAMASYKQRKVKDPDYSTFEFRKEQYEQWLQ